jgi:hypothetical protein
MSFSLFPFLLLAMKSSKIYTFILEFHDTILQMEGILLYVYMTLEFMSGVKGFLVQCVPKCDSRITASTSPREHVGNTNLGPHRQNVEWQTLQIGPGSCFVKLSPVSLMYTNA